MTKTIELQIEKCRALISGLRSNTEAASALGITSQEIDTLEANLLRLSAASEECEALREELSGKVRATNQILGEVKEAYASRKRTIKDNYPQEQWGNFGVMDKR